MTFPIHPTQPDAHDGPAGNNRLQLHILGPLRVWRGAIELDVGPRQQAVLFSLLLARAGRPIGSTELIDLIWGEDGPHSALNVISKYVGALRRLLEPGIPARDGGSYLHRRGNSYQFTAAPGMLDLVSFRELVVMAKSALGQQRREAALDCYVEALGLWHGHAADGFTHGSAALPIFAAIDGEFHVACAEAAELAVALRRPERVVPALQLAASMAPFHEPIQAALISALGAAGRQAEALAVFHHVRTDLADELGIDPGPALRAAYLQVVTQSSAAPVVAPPGVKGDGAPVRAASALLGRTEELAILRQAVELALDGSPALGIVEGEPGVGKTRLLQATAAEASQRGAFVVWGSCLEGDGTPSMWPWEQALRPVLDRLPAPVREKWLSTEIGGLLEPRSDNAAASSVPDSRTQFRLFEQVVSVVEAASMEGPLLLILDDLQWADTASLQLFGHLAARLPAGVAIVGALRDRAPTPGSGLSRVLAAAGRLPGHRRIWLGPLGLTEVTELVRRETGHDPGVDVARRIHARTAGNPFFVQELSRLLSAGGSLADGGASAETGVPATVRDVVRDRMAGLDHGARGVLQVAALIGRDVEVALLARAAGVDIAVCLTRLAPLQALGMLETKPGDPFWLRFAHDLVRESVNETTAQQHAMGLHLSVADALDYGRSDDDSVAEQLAYHLWAAGPLADPVRTAEALARAGRRAGSKNAFEAANRHLASAAQVARTAGLAELELSLLSQLALVAFPTGAYVGSTFDVFERGEQLAHQLGREVDAADFLLVRLVAAYASLEPDRGTWARRLYEQGQASADPMVQVYGWQAWGLRQWDLGNVGEAYRCFSRRNHIQQDSASSLMDNPFRRRGTFGQLLVSDEWAGWLAVITALQGDVETARVSLDEAYGAVDTPHSVSVWAYYHTMLASMAGDAAWVIDVAERWIAAGADRANVGQDNYVRLDWYWARALTGDDPAGVAAQAEQLLAAALRDPPRWGLAYHYGLIAEMWLAAGMPDKAATALDRADLAIKAHGQRYAEGLLLLLRARLLHARGAPIEIVRAAADAAGARSDERGAHLFAQRAERFLAGVEQNPT